MFISQPIDTETAQQLYHVNLENTYVIKGHKDYFTEENVAYVVRKLAILDSCIKEHKASKALREQIEQIVINSKSSLKIDCDYYLTAINETHLQVATLNNSLIL